LRTPISRPSSFRRPRRPLLNCLSPHHRDWTSFSLSPHHRDWTSFSREVGDSSDFLEKNAGGLKLCGQTRPAFSKVGKAFFEAWIIGPCRPRRTFGGVLATAFSIARHVTPPWHTPRKTIQRSRRFWSQDCLRATQQCGPESYSKR
jgi:hypothetical protein